GRERVARRCEHVELDVADPDVELPGEDAEAEGQERQTEIDRASDGRPATRPAGHLAPRPPTTLVSACCSAPSGSSRRMPRLAKIRRISLAYFPKSGVSRTARWRGRGRSISMISSIRPGRGDITTTRSERNTASEIECVTNSTVFFDVSQMFWRSRLSWSR